MFSRNGPLFFPVTFVSDEDFVNSFAGVLFDVGKPGSDVYGVSVELVYGILGKQPSCSEEGENRTYCMHPLLLYSLFSRFKDLLWKDRSSVTS